MTGPRKGINPLWVSVPKSRWYRIFPAHPVRQKQSLSIWTMSRTREVFGTRSVHMSFLLQGASDLKKCGTGWEIQVFQHNLRWKMLFVFQTFFTEKGSKKLKTFSLCCEFKVKNSKGISKGVKKIWIFHCFFQWKMCEKQTTFFTINCAENLESPNQCWYPQS
jgi:hypothetical protein